MEVGIIGLPNVGKSTLFNTLTKAHAQIGLYPFTTIDSNTGMVIVPDKRLKQIAGIVKPEKIVPTHIKFVDIAGLVKGASKGEGLGNQFLSYIRDVDIIVHVVRLFEKEDIPSSGNLSNPAEDIETVNLELILADLEITNRQLEKYSKLLKTGDKKVKELVSVLEKIKTDLEKGTTVRMINLSKEELDTIKDMAFLTAKKTIYVANIAENKKDPRIEQLEKISSKEDTEVIRVSAETELELTELSTEEAKEFKEELNIKSSGLEKLIHSSYKLLNLITFYTVVSNENKAWSINKGATAYEAAGKIHTDMQKGFIKAEVVNWQKLIEDGSLSGSRDKGHLSIEGKDYIVQDGDVIYFKFNN